VSSILNDSDGKPYDFPKLDETGAPPKHLTPFEKALAFTMNEEGGHLTEAEAKRVGDRGGETLWGFAKKYNPDIDYSTFTKEQAAHRAKTRYWDAIRGDELPPLVGFVLFDYAFNSGAPWAAMELQRAIGAKPDGRIGPSTLRKLRSKNPEEIARKLLRLRGAYYSVKSVEQPQFAKGWNSRLRNQAWSAGKVAGQHSSAPSEDDRSI